MNKFIEEFISKLKRSFTVLFNSIEGAEDTPVIAGLDAIVKYNGVTIAYATNVSIDEDFELQGIRTLGYHGDRDFKSMGYNATMSVGTFVLFGGAIEGALPTPTRANILSTGLAVFELQHPDPASPGTNKTLYICNGCKCATKGVSFDSGALVTKNTTWRVKEVKVGAVS